MEPIHVPPTPSLAFNKNRRVSDLIRAQTNHFKHLEDKLSSAQREQIPQHAIVSEEDAARYIAPMTRLLLARGESAGISAAQKPARTKRPMQMRSANVLSLAASADSDAPASKAKRPTAHKASSTAKTARRSRKEKK